ncbi:APC membrane recruitment protein 3 [Astyanax mexicanus]|uniref:APC membrane recruitment protein 3 n=1 Tax=Astyanax mexicanus TaxID=7994 RepID=A0A8T2M6S3_ASTMX|nr:APC membrane recruitment protein 3 [Astyanax mexicanus]
MEFPKSQKPPQGGRTGLKPEPGKGEIPSSSRHEPLASPGTFPATDTLDSPSPELCSSPEDWTQTCSTIKKSRTHDCVVERAVSPGGRDGSRTSTTHRHRKLVNSASFCGFGSTRVVLHENQNTPGCTREIIDYRNLTPQVPFVPSVAKSIPKKRIFLRKPRKAIKDFFVQKKQSDEKDTSPCTPSKHGMTFKRSKMSKSSRRRNQSRTSLEMKDILSDSSSECGADVCEDSVSLKSFGSQAGCGEIFVDEDYLVSLEGTPKIEVHKDAGETSKPSPTTPAFQGGKEQLASPAQPEVLDLFELWKTFNRTVLVGQNSEVSSDSKATTTPASPASILPSTNKAASPLESPSTPVANIPESLNHANTETPKSENQESTSDEGYCDYASNEDHTRSSLTPVHSGTFPRDTYSGDALYELFYDPSERSAEMTPIFDDEMDLTHSIIGQSSDLPLSMYSFHVGAEENLAPPLAVDFISHELLQSNWAGKDCLLKLCDTEISLAMGIVSWLKQKTSTGGKGDAWEEGKSQIPAGIASVPKGLGLKKANSREDMADFRSRETFQVDADHLDSVDSPKQRARVVSTVATPESLPRTPSSGQVCFRIFNINSPLTPTRDLQSPMAPTPGSGTGSLFVLAVNKESLCESCKASLKQGAKELHLCHSCTSFIERIKTSELWARATLQQSKTVGTPQSLKGGLLLSPSSSCGVASDISLLSLVEQCASQVSSLKINKYQSNFPDHEATSRKAIAESGKDMQPKKDPEKKFLKPKHKKKVKISTKGSLHFGDDPNVRNGITHDSHSPSVLEAEGLGLVTTNDSDDLVLETYKSLCRPQTNKLNDTDVSQASRPTSLPLSNVTGSEFSRKERHKVKEKPHERSRRHKKPVVNKEGLSDKVFPEEKKVERKRRMKK